MNKQPYELSIWRDIQIDNSGLSYFGDEKVVVIGSDTMSSPFKAYDVSLKRQSNGDRTLTFSMVYEIKDENKKIINPFFELIANETKLKFRDGEAYSPFDEEGRPILNNTKIDTDKRWHDFIVKTIDKDSNTRVANIVAKELHVNELSKNGWSVTLNTELENNYGTVTELAEKVLKGSNWKVDENSYVPIEGIEEPLFEYEVTTNLAANGIENGQKDVELNGQTIYFFYKDVEFDETLKISVDEEPGCWKLKKAESYQILYFGENKDIASAPIDDDLVIIDDNYDYNYSISFSEESLYVVTPKNINGRRIQDKQRVQYESVLDKYVDVYINEKTNEKIYGYKETDYSVSPIVQNHIVNSVNFTSNTGWKNVNSSAADPILTLYPQPTITISENNVPSINQDNVENILIFDNNNEYTNNGPTISGLRVIKDEEYIFRFRGRWIKDKEPLVQDYNLKFQLKEDSLADVFSNEENINIKSNQLEETGFLKANESPREKPTILSKLYIDEKGYGYYKFNISNFSLENHNIIINISASAVDGEFYLSELQLFKYEVGDREVKEIIKEENKDVIKTTLYTDSVLFPGDAPKSNIEEKNIYYKVDDNKNIEYYAKLPEDYSPKKSKESVRFFETQESNYFNNIQSLAELFEVWVGFDIEHYQDGRTVYEKIIDAKDEENNNLELYQPKKTVKFYQYSPTGKDNYAGFKYGINLKGIKRNIDSNSIASKIIVKPNNQEYAIDGMCTIARAPSNQTGETEIFNFDYYIHQGLLSEFSVINDLYGTSNTHLRYYPKIKKCNEIIQENSLLVSKYSNTIAELEKFYNLYEAEVISYNNEISELTLTYQSFDPADEKRKQYEDEIARLLILRNTAEINRDNIKKIEIVNEEKITTGSLQQYLDWSELAQKNIDEQTKKKEKLREILYNKYYRFIQEGTWTDESYVDDELYYLEASKIAAVSAFPQVSYVINILSVEGLEGYEPYKFSVGDRTYIEDVEFFGYVKRNVNKDLGNINTPYRMEVIVTEHNQNFDDPAKTTITVKNYKNQFEELFQKITATTQSLQYKTGEYTRAANVITPTGEIKVSTLEQSFKNNSMILSSSDNQSVIWDTGTGIEVIDNRNANNRVRIVGGGVFISNDGGGVWSNAISGDGINTKYLIAGQIDVSKINIMEGSVPYFRWDKNGITAFQVDHSIDSSNISAINELPAYDLQRYVRFNQYGIYAVGGTLKDGLTVSQFEQELDKPDSFYNKLNYIGQYANFSLTWKGLTITATGDDTSEWQTIKLDAHQGLRLLTNAKFSEAATKTSFNTYVSEFDGYNKTVAKTETYQVNDPVPIIAIGQFPNIGNDSVYGIRLRNTEGFVTFMTDNRGEIWATDRLFVGPWKDKTSATSTTGLNARTITLDELNSITNSQFIAELSENPNLVEHSIRIWAGAPQDKIELSPFLVLENGTVIASKAYISGNIQAESGNISGLLTIGNGRHGIDGSSEANPIIWSKDENGIYKFWIDSDGILHAKGAEISGTIGAEKTTVKKLLIPDEKSGGIDSTGNVRIWINEETENDRETSIFYVTEEGHLHTKEAYLDGNLYITKNEDGSYQSGVSNGITNDIILYAGAQNNDRTSAVFTVDKSGNVIAKSLNLGEGILTAADAELSGTLKIGTITIDGTNGIIHTANSSSVAGWSIDQDGNAQFNNINARGEITSAIFSYNSVNTMGGNLYLAPVYYDYENTAKFNDRLFTIEVDEITYERDIWTNDSNIEFSFIGDNIEYNNIKGKLTKQEGNKFIINPELSGTTTFEDFTVISNFSISLTTGCGINLDAGARNGPAIIITDLGAGGKIAAQLGSLKGVSDAVFGQLGGYGLYSDRAYLSGRLYLPGAGITNETIQYEPNAVYVDEELIDNSDNYIRMWAGAEPDKKANAPFVVTEDGSLYATKGKFNGVIEAVNSTFSGWLQTAGILIDDNQATYSLSGGGTFEYEGYEKVYYTKNVAPTINTFLLMEEYKDETEEVLKLKNKDLVFDSVFENTILSLNSIFYIGKDKINISNTLSDYLKLIEAYEITEEQYKELNGSLPEDSYSSGDLIKAKNYFGSYTKPDYFELKKLLDSYHITIEKFNELNGTNYTEDTILDEQYVFNVGEDSRSPESVFYVSYDRNNKQIFPDANDKILQIDKNGISIWEGGLSVYSDYAAGWRDSLEFKPSGKINKYYGYDEENPAKEVFPYIKAIDNENFRLYSTGLTIGKFIEKQNSELPENYNSFIKIADGKISFINYNNNYDDTFVKLENEVYNSISDWDISSNQGILEIGDNLVTFEKENDEVILGVKGKIRVDDEIDTLNNINFIDENGEDIIVNIVKFINKEKDKYPFDRGIDFII